MQYSELKNGDILYNYDYKRNLEVLIVKDVDNGKFIYFIKYNGIRTTSINIIEKSWWDNKSMTYRLFKKITVDGLKDSLHDMIKGVFDI